MAYKLGFDCTNNIVEYEALILGLKSTLLLKIKNIEIYYDSQLMINQVNEIYITKDEKLQPYKLVIVVLLDEFDSYSIQIIPQTNNRHAYAMASVSSLVPIAIEDEEIVLSIKRQGTPYLKYLDDTCVFHSY